MLEKVKSLFSTEVRKSSIPGAEDGKEEGKRGERIKKKKTFNVRSAMGVSEEGKGGVS